MIETLTHLSEQQREIQQVARDFATERLAPNAGVWDRVSEQPASIVRELGDLGPHARRQRGKQVAVGVLAASTAAAAR